MSSLYDVSQLPLYVDNTFSAQSSSYDPTGGNDDGFSGKNSFIRRNADSSLVILDIKGARYHQPHLDAHAHGRHA